MKPRIAERVPSILQGELSVFVPFQILILNSISSLYKMMRHEAPLV